MNLSNIYKPKDSPNDNSNDSPTNNMYKENTNFYVLIFNNFIWSMLGIIFGIIINNITLFTSTILKIKNVIFQNILQIILCCFILAVIQISSEYFAWVWQNTTGGLFFIAFFFSVQSNIFEHIKNIYNYK
jgi:hypothetical protein